MNKEVWIIGNNISIDTYPETFFNDKFTIGINSASIKFQTSLAFSAYPVHIEEYLKNGIPIDKIIGVRQTFPLPKYDEYGNPKPGEFPNLILEKIYYNNAVRLKLSEIEKEMDYLIKTKDKNFAYHNNGTSAQMAIYWCILHDHYPINLVGCNQTMECTEFSACKCKKYGSGKFCVSKEIWEDSRNYTREIIRCINKHGDYIRFYENYNDYLKRNQK